jgi:hypothetical protein
MLFYTYIHTYSIKTFLNLILFPSFLAGFTLSTVDPDPKPTEYMRVRYGDQNTGVIVNKYYYEYTNKTGYANQHCNDFFLYFNCKPA